MSKYKLMEKCLLRLQKGGFKVEEVKLTVSQVALQLGETVHIIRNWLKEFRDYIPSEKSPGGYNLFTQEGIDVLTRIQKMHREQNLSTRQIDAILAGADKPTVKNDITETTETIKSFLEDQRKFNMAIIEKLEDQRQQFESFVQRRDEQIMFVLRELQQQKQLTGKKNPWWKAWKKG